MFFSFQILMCPFLCRRAAYLVMWIVLTCVCSPQLNAFNIDTDNVRVLTGQKGSQFGYSVRFDVKAFGKGHINLLVGAPKNKVTLNQTEYVSGSLITCYDVLDPVDNCKEEPAINRFPDFIDDKASHENEGYSSSFSVSDDGNRIVCAPFWSDLRYSRHLGFAFMIGRCVVFLEREGKMYERNTIPYYNHEYIKEQEYYYGLAAFGLSTDVYGSNTFAVGSPGLTIFEGGVAIIDYSGEKVKFSVTVEKYRNTLDTTAYGYLGYDVKFGNLCKSPTICLAAGAPQLYTVGVVRLYQWLDQSDLVNFQTLKGEKTWSYFGAALCTADIDGDKLDELIVGAPYYTGDKHDLDIGRVYVYKRNEISKYFYLDDTLHGQRAKYSRFGSAIQVIGDINLDGFPDIAVGAPGEEDGTGCVYIYMGGANGLRVDYQQRICAKDMRIPKLNSQLKSFGSAFSGSSQSLQGPYPIFAVSAFQSDTVVILKAKQVLAVTASLTANPNPVDINGSCQNDNNDGPCTVVLVCLHHQIQGQNNQENSRRNFYFRVTMRIDTQSLTGRMKKAVIQSELIAGEGKCLHFVVKIKKKRLDRDRFTPIQIEVTYELDPKKIDSTTPILNPETKNVLHEMITFSNHCGSDNICNVDLKVQGRILSPNIDDGDEPYITFGHTKEIIALVTISNSQEPSYWTEIRVKLSQPLTLIQFMSDKIRQCQVVSDTTDPTGTTVVCNYYHPLALDDLVGVMLTFDTENLAENEKILTISADVKATDEIHNPEVGPSDNQITMAADVFIVTDVHIFGVAAPRDITIPKAKKISLNVYENVQDMPSFDLVPMNKIMLNHKVLIKNRGPSFLPKTKVYLNVPFYIPDGTQLVTDISVKLITGTQITDCSKSIQSLMQFTDDTTVPSSNFSIEETATIPENGSTFPKEIINRRKREAIEDDTEDDENNESRTYILSCDVTPEYCLTFICEPPDVIEKAGHAEMNVTLTLDKDNIPIPKNFAAFKLELKTDVEEPDHILFKPWNGTNMQQAAIVTQTLFHLYESGGEINLWIIIGSIVAGVIVMALIVLIMWRIGFFERKRHFQVEKWRRESQKSRRESQKSKS